MSCYIFGYLIGKQCKFFWQISFFNFGQIVTIEICLYQHDRILTRLYGVHY
jgi:hypothetical protein